jgi:hypothetical protein
VDDADPDPALSSILMPIRIRIRDILQIIHKSEIGIYFLTFIHSSDGLHGFFPTFYFDADPDQDPGPSSNYTQVGNLNFFF